MVSGHQTKRRCDIQTQQPHQKQVFTNPSSSFTLGIDYFSDHYKRNSSPCLQLYLRQTTPRIAVGAFQDHIQNLLR